MITYVSIVLKRLEAQKTLTALLITAFVLVIAITTSIPVFAGAVGRNIARKNLELRGATSNYPLFSVRFYAMPTSSHPMTLTDVSYANDWLSDSLVRQIGVPLKASFMQSESSLMRMQARAEDPHYSEEISSVKVTTVWDIKEHIRVREGADFGSVTDAEQMAVWVLPSFAEQLGLDIGETFSLSYSFSGQEHPIVFRVEGVWEAKDARAAFWYKDPSVFYQDTLLTTKEQYNKYIAPMAPEGTGFNFWYYTFDNSKINLNYAEKYLRGLGSVRRDVESRLPRGEMDYAPVRELHQGQERKEYFTGLLLILSVPIMSMLLFFIVMLSTVVADSQKQETATLVSRGASWSQISSLVFLETLIILLIASPLGLFGGLQLAHLMGSFPSFLEFADRPFFETYLASIDKGLVGGSILVCLIARLLAAMLATDFSIVTYESQHMTRRSRMSPAWRLLLFICLVIITGYAHFQLSQQGSFGSLAAQAWQDADQNPLLLLTPSLFLVTASLAAAEFFVLLLHPLAFLGRFLNSAAGHLSCTNLARNARRYRVAIFMLTLCLGMGVFYATIAKSADQWLLDHVQYQVGADLTFEQAITRGSEEISQMETWLPIDDYEGLSGVFTATRVGEFSAETPVDKDLPVFRLLAVERMRFPEVAYYRSDFSSESLGSLMNALAQEKSGIVLPKDMARSLNLNEGDELPVELLVGQDWHFMRFTIAGTFRYFPTMLDEHRKPVAVTSLDQLQREVGSFPHEIWMRLERDADAKEVLDDLGTLGISPIRAQNIEQFLDIERQRLERVGIFGALSISFITAILLAVTTLILNNAASVARRSYYLSVLRAMGMRKVELVSSVSAEYLVTLSCGLLAGTIVGLLSAQLYVPFFPFNLSPQRPMPPYIPHMDWQRTVWIAINMGALLVILGMLTLWRAANTKLFETLRLGVRE